MTDYFARIKFYIQRSVTYYQIIQALMIVVLVLRPYDLSIWQKCLIMLMTLLGALLVGKLDRKFKILEKEISFGNKENKELRDILDSLQRIEEKIDGANT